MPFKSSMTEAIDLSVLIKINNMLLSLNFCIQIFAGFDTFKFHFILLPYFNSFYICCFSFFLKSKVYTKVLQFLLVDTLAKPNKNAAGEVVQLVLTSSCADNTKTYHADSDSCL